MSESAIESDYEKYRGKCKEMSEKLCAEDSSLRLVRGYYYCPFWGKQEHWWCEKMNEDGTVEIVDPTKDQFLSKGLGEYEEFDGVIECAQCGTKTTEYKAQFYGRYAFCSTPCACRFVGV